MTRPGPVTASAPVSRPPRSLRSRRLVKAIVAGVALAALAALFVRSARTSRAEPYTLPAAALADWTVSLIEARAAPDPMLGVLVPPELIRSLGDQIFKRNMESLSAPTQTVIPLVLRSELEQALAARATPETLLAAARAAGLDASTLRPRCLGYRRLSSPAGGTAQLYFVLFEEPAFARFRAGLAAQAPGGAFDPAALSPVLFVAGTNTDFQGWMPLRADPEKDCVADIRVRP